LRNQLAFSGCSAPLSVGELVGEPVGVKVVGESEGEAVGGEVGHSEPKRVPPLADEQYPEKYSRVTPAGMLPHKPGLSHNHKFARVLRAPSSVGILPINRLLLSSLRTYTGDGQAITICTKQRDGKIK